MTRRIAAFALITCLLTAAAVYAGQGLAMKCQAQPEKDPATGKTGKPCGYEAQVTFGGGMFFNQITGYCRACKKFVYIQWTRDGIPAQIKAIPRPVPLGEVWDASTGKVLTIDACPHLQGPVPRNQESRRAEILPSLQQASLRHRQEQAGNGDRLNV